MRRRYSRRSGVATMLEIAPRGARFRDAVDLEINEYRAGGSEKKGRR
jgi:hypothetical protein